VYGTVAENIEVDAKYDLAVETALGPALQNIIVEKTEDAKKCIAYLKKNNSGRATFLPLDSIKGGRLPLDERTLRKPGVLGLAADLIRYDPRFQAVMESLLGRIAITENLDAAIELARANNYRFKIVTLQGDQVNPGGSLTGGSARAQANSLLSRTRVIEDLTVKIKELKDRYEGMRREYLLGNEKLAEMKDLRRDLELQIKACSEKKSIIGIDRKYVQERIARLDEALKALEYDLADTRVQYADLEAEIAGVKANIRHSADNIEKLQTEQENLEKLLETDQQASPRPDGTNNSG
jgi:chromosome segregation protein